MRDTSTLSLVLRELASKGDTEAKAALAIVALADKMRVKGGESGRANLMKSAAVMRANGNESVAKTLEDAAAKLPPTTRGMGIDEARKEAAPFLAVIGSTDADVYHYGLSALIGKKFDKRRAEEMEKKENGKAPVKPQTK